MKRCPRLGAYIKKRGFFSCPVTAEPATKNDIQFLYLDTSCGTLIDRPFDYDLVWGTILRFGITIWLVCGISGRFTECCYSRERAPLDWV